MGDQIEKKAFGLFFNRGIGANLEVFMLFKNSSILEL
jgi:hypothetical protein